MPDPITSIASPAPSATIEEKAVAKKSKRAVAMTKPNAAAVRSIQKGLKRFITILEVASQKDVNESDTSNIINDILGDVLGYDKFFDVTTEYKIRGQYADYGIRLNNKVYAFIEVKAINIALNQNHLFQVASYAVHEGVDWAILTNGNVWQLYRIEDSKPVEFSLVASIDLFDKDLRFPAKCVAFSVFHKKSLTGGYIERLWKEKTCVNAEILKKILHSKVGIDFLRKQIKRQSGYRVEAEQVQKLLNTIQEK